MENVLGVQIDQHEGQHQQHKAHADDDVQLLLIQGHPVIPVLLLKLPLGLELLFFCRFFLGVFFFHGITSWRRTYGYP